MHQFLIALSSGSKYVGDVELIYAADKFQVCCKYMQLLKFPDIPQIPVYNISYQFVLFWYFDIEYASLETCQVLLSLLSQKNTSFSFCSYSDLLQLKIFEEKDNFSQKHKFLSTQDSYRGN